jgi:hypothetical protein
VLVSVVRAQVEDRSLSLIDSFRQICVFLEGWADIELSFLHDRSKAEIHEPHHSLFPKLLNMFLTSAVGI